MVSCNTQTTAFETHGIDDGIDLTTTYRRLSATGHSEPEPTSSFITALTVAFRYAYITHADAP